MKHFLALLFLALAACSNPRPPASGPWFHDATGQSALRFTHDPGLSGKYYLTEIMGSGVAVLDYDNDGDLDVFLVQGHPGKGTSRLFRNELIPSGKLVFTDVTAESGLGVKAVGMGVATGDFNNDGFLDLYLTSYGDNHLFRNNGDGTFTNVTAQARVNDPRWSTSAIFFDYDLDGRLDLFVLNYTDFSYASHKDCFTSTGEPDYCSPSVYAPVPDTLFRNNGDGTFTNVTARAGIDKAYGPGLGVIAAGFDNNGYPDLYIANDGKANLLWINRGDGTFAEEGLMRGAAYSEDGVPKAGMGISAGDYDNDGDFDVFIANLTAEGGTLYRNDGAGNFSDASLATALRPHTLMFTGFGLHWFDFDHDGHLDLFIGNGAVTKIEALRGHQYPFHQRNLLLRNNPAAGRFEELPAAGVFALEEVTRGAAFGDINNDGAIDIVISNNHGPARLLLNQAARGPWLIVSLRSTTGDPYAMGAEVTLLEQGRRLYKRLAGTAGSYQSASDPRIHFGWPDNTRPDAIEVRWPGGQREKFPLREARRHITLVQGTGSL